MTDHKKGLLAVFIAAALWSTGGIFIKLISWDAFQLGGIRSFIAALVILAVYRAKSLRVSGASLLNALLYSGVMILFVLATKKTTAANAIFLQYTAPIYVLILEPILLKVKFERINLYAILITFGGMLLFFIGELSPGHLEGNIIALITGVILAGFFLGLKKIPAEMQPSSIFYGNIFAAIIGLSISGLPVEAAMGDIGMVTFLGIFQIGIPYIVFSYGLTKVQAIEASLIAMIEPVLNPVWVLFWYGEAPAPYAILGGIVILISVGVRAYLSERQRQTDATI